MDLNYKKLDWDDIDIPIPYAITLDNKPSYDDIIARELNIDLNSYLNLLKECGAICYDDQYNFLNEDDAIKAVVALKLIINER